METHKYNGSYQGSFRDALESGLDVLIGGIQAAYIMAPSKVASIAEKVRASRGSLIDAISSLARRASTDLQSFASGTAERIGHLYRGSLLDKAVTSAVETLLDYGKQGFNSYSFTVL